MQKNQNAKDVNAKSVEEAIEQGLAELGVSRDQVDVEVINEGKRGLFGIGAEDAHVRLTVKDTAPSTKPVEAPAEAAPSEEEIVAGELPHEILPTSAVLSSEPAPSSEVETDLSPDEVEIAKNHLDSLLRLMGINAKIVTRSAPDLVEAGEAPPVVLDITGKDLGILIGRRSETLQALQYMVRWMVSKELGSWQRVVVDVESYRSRRRRSLQKMARRMAERAVSNDERVVLESMSAYERRIIHIALRDHPDVYTKSVGRDNHRKVTIIPK